MHFLKNTKQNFALNIKNIPGWTTNRKIVVFSVDDYGNVRLASREAREELDKAGLKVRNRFDAFDSLENREDLLQLYDVLSSVKDKNGKNAVFSPFAVPANIDFELIELEKYDTYVYELLPETFSKLGSAYKGVWNIWKEGIERNLLVPQFHGREHLNIKVFEEKLKHKDFEVLTALKNRSYTSISNSGYPTINITAAFDFWEFSENEKLSEIIIDGLNAYENIFGYRARHFNPPGGREHSILHQTLFNNGIDFIDSMRFHKEHQGLNQYKRHFNYTGKMNEFGQFLMVKNCVFEPTDNWGLDWVAFTVKQIETSFRWHKPANISSHRVNFSGNISPSNRNIGLESLKELLREIVKKWPDVEFMSSVELMDLIKFEKIKNW